MAQPHEVLNHKCNCIMQAGLKSKDGLTSGKQTLTHRWCYCHACSKPVQHFVGKQSDSGTHSEISDSDAWYICEALLDCSVNDVI